MSLHDALKQVHDFHRKLRISRRQPLSRVTTREQEELMLLLPLLTHLSTTALFNFHKLGSNNAQLLRMHLLCEELAEVCDAMANKDEVSLLDGLADLMYVVLGTADVFDLPLAEGFDEVHKSNMSKERQASDKDGERVRDKGPNYSPADLRDVLAVYRKQQCSPHVLSDDLTQCVVCEMLVSKIVHEQIPTYGRASCKGGH